MKNNIVLLGFMGCGKSTVGKLLAAKTGYSFVDTDSLIEKKENMSVNDIFKEKGEAYFRAAEAETVKELTSRERLIIAVGGGTVLNAENVEALKASGFCVWLKVSPEAVLKRLKNDTTRPLLQRNDKEAAVKELITAREPLYRAACDAQINADCSAEEAADSVILLFGK